MACDAQLIPSQPALAQCGSKHNSNQCTHLVSTRRERYSFLSAPPRRPPRSWASSRAGYTSRAMRCIDPICFSFNARNRPSPRRQLAEGVNRSCRCRLWRRR
jgi:hypothetical protein